MRKSIRTDKSKVLEFCKNTFHWGDYIHEVWETWHSDPNGVLLVAEMKPSYSDLHKAFTSRDGKSTCLEISEVVGVGHAHVCPKRKQLWIEGIRINSKYRRKGIASKLIDRMIKYGKEFDSNIRLVAAITAESNTASRYMLQKNKFQKRARWEYYTSYIGDNNHQTNMNNSAISMNIFESNQSCVPNEDTCTSCMNMEVSFASMADIEEIAAYLTRSRTFISSGRRYVQSWKWYELNLEDSTISELIANRKLIIVRTVGVQNIRGLAITNDYCRQNNSAAEQIEGQTQGWKRISNEEYAAGYNDDDADDDADDVVVDSSFKLVYVDVPTTDSLKNLLVFILDWVISSSKFDRIQLFVPDQMYQEDSGYYEVTDVLTKFGFSRSDRFLLYIRSI